MKAPSSVYRIQLNEHFTLKQAIKLLPYLKDMGIDGVYCSPYFAAHSPHGYDIIDPNRLNPQVATPKDFQAFCKKLKKLGLYHIADVVPNHMGILGGNKWWLDVLKKGQQSKYAPFFDIDWTQKFIRIPILGVPYEEALKKGQFKIVRKKGKAFLEFAGEDFPLRQKLKKLPKNLDELDALLRDQHYRLVSWLSSGDEISYRRFFNISELIGLRMEDEKVLKAHHKWLFQLLKEKKVNGLRIDHPDGLYDPKSYFDALRKKHKGLIVVEKILGWREELPYNWDVEGSVGYEFLNMLTGLFVKKSQALTDVYSRFIQEEFHFDQMLYEKKKFYLETEMEGDVKGLSRLLESNPIEAISELLATFPVYRSYIRPKGAIPNQDRSYIAQAFEEAKKKSKVPFELLEHLFTLQKDTPKTRDFLMRFQQLSAPIMAKGFEDITLYNYNRLLTLNEVGSEPQRGGITPQEFHDFCLRKREKWPLGFLASSTHDTKRSLDARMQIAVLSEIPEKWEKALNTWTKLNEKHKTDSFPDWNAEYFFYQILLGAWPSRPSATRMWESFQKSIREARVHTSWCYPNAAYEKACATFVRAILKKGSPFLKEFTQFQRQIQEYGEWNSLSATALKLGCPGIVELYQGCENWRYLLVDPDNRKPVDYTQPQSLKTDLHERALNFRSRHKKLFLEGKYIPLKVTGSHRDHVIAYLRTYRKQACLVAGVRFFSSLKSLKNTHIQLPKNLGKGEEVFSFVKVEGKELEASNLFKNTPFAWVFWSRI